MMGNGYVHAAGTDGWPMLLLGILLTVVAVAMIAHVVRSYLRPQSGGAQASVPPSGASAGQATESPQEILKRRYAAGDIDRELYQEILDELNES